MARQTGDIIIEGTIDDITFYKMEGKGYARSKSYLKGERVRRDPRFRRTMQSANRFGRGNQLAAKVYRSLPRQEQMYGLFKELKRIAILTLKEGKGEAEVLMLLQQRVAKEWAPLPVLNLLPVVPFRRPQVDKPVQKTIPCTKKLFGARRKSKQKVLSHKRGLQVLRE